MADTVRERLLVDPAWSPTDEEPEPPDARVAGRWPVGENGALGRFEPNPEYAPRSATSPSDPVDAVLQGALDGGAVDGDALVAVLDEITLGVAVDDDGRAIVVPAPDEMPSVVTVTAPYHRARLTVPAWRDVSLAQLAEALPDHGLDLLLNPGAPASMRVLAGTVRAVARGEV